MNHRATSSTVWVVTIGDTRHGDHVHSVWADLDAALNIAVPMAFVEDQRNYGGSAEYEVRDNLTPPRDEWWFAGASGSHVDVRPFEVRTALDPHGADE